MNKKDLSLFVLSFFKSERIDYYYDRNNSLITFPCLDCGGESKMIATTSEWNCSICKNKGRITALISIREEIGESNLFSLYDPLKEERRIISELLSEIAGYVTKELEKKKIREISNRMKELIIYLKSTQ